MDEYWLLIVEGVILLAHLLSWLVVVHALLHKRDPRSALGWSATALFLPGIGSILYLLFGIGRAESRAARLMRLSAKRAPSQTCPLHGGARADSPPGHVRNAHLPGGFRNLARIGFAITGRALSGGNTIVPLYNGESAYSAMLDAIDMAKERVFLTTYIFNGGATGKAFCDALARAAARGVDVRVLVDGLGGMMYSWTRPWKKLPDKGVRVAHFLEPRLLPPSFSINLRNHRKILVCDTVGFTGGMNISDGYVPGHGAYSVQDVHFQCVGPVVAQLEEAFLLDWGFCTHEYDAPSRIGDEMCGDSLCRMVLDGLGSGRDPLHHLLCAVMAGAVQHIRIMSPYFLPTREMVGALRAAALRGVNVSVILPKRNNLFYMQWAMRHMLPTMLESGVRMYYQPPPFAHTKLLMVDSYYTQFGSANLDPRSLRLNFELNIETFDTSFTRTMERYYDKVLATSHEITRAELEAQSLPVRLRNAACWIFSPYL